MELVIATCTALLVTEMLFFREDLVEWIFGNETTEEGVLQPLRWLIARYMHTDDIVKALQMRSIDYSPMTMAPVQESISAHNNEFGVNYNENEEDGICNKDEDILDDEYKSPNRLRSWTNGDVGIYAAMVAETLSVRGVGLRFTNHARSHMPLGKKYQRPGRKANARNQRHFPAISRMHSF